MTIKHCISIDFHDHRIPPVIHVVQNDCNTRCIEASLYCGGIKYDIPEESSISLACAKPGGASCWYDTLPDGSPAYTVSENTVSINLVDQVVDVSGKVTAAIVICSADGKQLSTFPFVLEVIKHPAAGCSIANSYYNIQSLKDLNDQWRRLNEDLTGMLATYISYSPMNLTEEQKAQARANIGAMECGVSLGSVLFGSDKDGTETVMAAEAPDTTDNGYIKSGRVSFYATDDDQPVVIGHLADGVHDDDAATVGQVKAVAQSGQETDEKYFEIDYDGLVSLKPEYRGAVPALYAQNYPFCESDNGPDLEGSLNHELPESIVIPQNVDGEKVMGFQKGMFCCNRRIRKVVIPSNVKAIANGMFREAIYLEKVENTEQIETIGAGAFSKTRIEEIRFPNLQNLSSSAFTNCSCLQLIDIGNITSIGTSEFDYCENLVTVLGGQNVTTIGKRAFYATRRLKSLSFMPNVTSIGNLAFFSSRCDIDTSENCTFGTYATYKQFEAADYWTGVAFTPCKTPLNSVFHQNDPRWAGKQIADYVDEDGEPLRYGPSGCAFISLAEIYSAFEDVHFDSPEEFVPILQERNLLQYDYRYRDTWSLIAEGLGYQTEYISTMSKENLQKVYDALAGGALLYKSVGVVSSDGTVYPYGGHATVAYGLNTDGEMLMADSSMHCYEVDIYENHKTAWDVYKHGDQYCDVVIVRKV